MLTEHRRVPRRLSRIGTGGAVLLASLVFVVSVVALVAGLVAARQLRESTAESRRLFAVQERSDTLVRLQLDEETSLRGYLISKRKAFLDPYLSAPTDPFDDLVRSLHQSLAESDLSNARTHLQRISGWHDQWRRDVAAPLIANPTLSNATRLESLAKILDDRIRREAAALRDQISAKNSHVEESLETNIG
ncbi:MAG: CHASE3 domain-containing protein, partial [Candidatus Eremiobacteraeota bacterium]|nr:CHASE3 domain-containing protein [Candidatus Eremiobacteraeota bacterium]